MHEVHGSAPELRLSIQLSSLLHEIRDVSYVHADLVNVAGNVLDGERIIQVLSCDGINGKYPVMPQVLSELDLLFGDSPLARLIVEVPREDTE